MNRWDVGEDGMPQDGYRPEDAGYDQDEPYADYTHTGFAEEDYSEDNEELDDMHRFHVAMNVFDLVSVLIGLAVILVLVAILVSLITWLQSDITQSFTLLTSQLQ